MTIKAARQGWRYGRVNRALAIGANAEMGLNLGSAGTAEHMRLLGIGLTFHITLGQRVGGRARITSMKLSTEFPLTPTVLWRKRASLASRLHVLEAGFGCACMLRDAFEFHPIVKRGELRHLGDCRFDFCCDDCGTREIPSTIHDPMAHHINV